MSRKRSDKTVSCNSYGMVISYGDVNKHQFMRYETPSHIKKIQLEGTVKYQKIEEPIRLNKKQKDLYSKTMYGFKAYTKEEAAKLSREQRYEITVNYTKVQRILRNWKQDITFSFIDKLLVSLFPKSSIAKGMSNTKGHIEEIAEEDEISFKDLGIKQEHIIGKLMEFSLLPKNFYELV